MATQFNTRIPDITVEQIDNIASEYGLTKTQVLILAIDRLHRQLLPNPNWMAELTPEEREKISPTE